MTTTRTTMTPKLEDAEFMAANGETLTGALHRLCSRAGRTDIYTTLAGRETP